MELPKFSALEGFSRLRERSTRYCLPSPSSSSWASFAFAANYDIPTEFPEEVMKQIENIPDEVPEEDKVGRKDIRDWQTVTIDGEDAKDLDDAVTLTKEDGIYTLGVHIADVSHYVTENSPLDKEAVKRGTSVYLVDRVIPMIPHKLSNGICSLNHDVDRLALSCIMKINEKGEIIDHEIVESLINVNERMTYTAVKEIIVDKNPETMERYKDLVPMFELMAELSEILRERRYKRGAIDFEFPECKIKLNQGGKPISIEPYDRNKATKIIEDFMLAANETIAEDFYWRQLPFVYRNHEEPDMEKVSQLTTFINNFGYSVKMSKEQIHPKELQKFGLNYSASLSQYGLLQGMAMPMLYFPSSFLTSFASLLIPKIAKERELHHGKAVAHITGKAVSYAIAFGLFFSAVFVVFGQSWGNAFYHSESAGEYLRVLAPIVPLIYLDVVVDSLLKGLDEQFNSMKYNFSDSLIRVLLVLCLLRFFGMESYICILFFSTIFNAALSLHRLLKVTKVRLSLLKNVLLPLLCAVLSVAITNFLLSGFSLQNAFLQLALQTIFSGAIFTFGFFTVCQPESRSKN